MKYIKALPGTPVDPKQMNANLDIVSNELDLIEKKINTLLVSIDTGLQRNREELYEHLKSLSQTRNDLIGKISYYEYLIQRYHKEFENLIAVNEVIIDYLNNLGQVIESAESFEDVIRSIPQPPQQASQKYEQPSMPQNMFIVYPTSNQVNINFKRTMLTKDFGAFINKKQVNFNYTVSIKDEEEEDFIVSGDYNNLKNPDFSGMINIAKHVKEEVEYVPFTILFEQFDSNEQEGLPREPFNIKGISFVPQSNSSSQFNNLGLGEMYLESIKVYGVNSVSNIILNEKVYSMGEYDKYFDTQDVRKVEMNFIQPNYHIETSLQNEEEYVYDVGLYYFAFILEEQNDTQEYALKFSFSQDKVYDYVVNGNVSKNDVNLYKEGQPGQSIIGMKINQEDTIICQIEKDSFYINNIVIFYD